MTLRWDPLEKGAETAIEIVSAAKKREINNILKSYVGYYDPFCELIQNAMDAVDTREKDLGEDEYVKKIWIKIDLQQNRISVTDNGVGFNKEQFETFLCPNLSYKTLGVTRGNKGVGATYLAYGFNYLQLATKTPGFDCIAEFSDGRKWVDDKSGVVTRPIVTEGKAIHKAFEQIDRGSSFTIQFGGENTRPKDLSWVSADLAEQWKTILLVKTPLGHITIGEHPYKQICFDVSVVASDGTSSDVIDQKAEYVFPHNVIQGCKALDEIKNALQKKLDQGIDPGGLPPQYRNLNAIYT